MEMVIRRVPGWDGTKENTELYHHGIIGQKWGRRRFQNADGSLTSAGRARYGAGDGRLGDAAARVQSRIQLDNSNIDVGTRRASNLGEVGTGVNYRSRLGSHSSLSVSDDLSSIKPAMRMKGKDFCDNLLDKDVQELRDREMVQIGRFYTEKLYQGTGAEGLSSSINGANSKFYARMGKSQTGGESGYHMSRGDMRERMLTRADQDRQANISRLRKSYKDRGMSYNDYKDDPMYKLGRDEIESDYDTRTDRDWDKWTDPKTKRSRKW